MSWQDELMSDYEAEAILTVAKQSDKIAELEKQVTLLKQENAQLKQDLIAYGILRKDSFE